MHIMATRILGVVLSLLTVGTPVALAQEIRADHEASTSPQPSVERIDFDQPLIGSPASPTAPQRILAPSLATSGTDYTISGKVRDEQTRVPIAQAHIAVLDAQTGQTLQDSIVTDADGLYKATLSTDDTETGVEDQPELRASYWVSTPSPHPIPAAYAHAVTVRYTAPVARAGPPELELFDLLGRRLDPSRSQAGGLYFYRLRFPDGQVTNTASLVRLGSGPLQVKLVRLSGEATGSSLTGRASNKSWNRLDVILIVEKTGYQTLEQNASLNESTETVVDLRLMPNNPTQQPDEVTYDVEYASDAIVIEGNAMDALVEADTAQHRFVFDANALQQASIDLQIGQVLLIEGIELGRLTDVQKNGSEVTIETEEATLNEVIQHGTIGWEKTIDFSAYRTAQVTLGKQGQGCSPTNIAPDHIKYTCEADPYTLTFEFKPGNGVVEAKAEVVKKTGNNTSARLTGIGTVREFSAGGTVGYEDGELSSADLQYNGVRADMTLEIAAAGSGSGDLNFKLPTPAIKIPFTVGPIPMQIGIGVQAVLSLDVPAEATASATASVDISYDGNHGLQYEGSDVDFEASVNGQDITKGSFDSASNFATVDAQYGVAFPRISLHVLTKEVAWVHAGFTTGTRLTFGPVCKTGYGRILVDAGYGLNILGVDLFQEKINLVDEQKRTDGCDN